MIYDNASTIEDFSNVVQKLLDKHKIYLGENALVSYIACSDEQCSHVEWAILRLLEYKDYVYERRVFGGILIPHYHTYESISPASHHIPTGEGYLLVLHFTHIGYNGKEYGKFRRWKQSSESASCGAIVGLWKGLSTKDADLNALSTFMKSMREESKDDILSLTRDMMQMSIAYSIEELQKMCKVEEHLKGLLYVGGIEFDSHYGNRISIMNSSYIDKKGVHNIMVK